MSANASDIHVGLREALSAVPGLRIADHLPEQVSPPMAVILLQNVQYHRAMQGGLSEWTFVISCVTGRMGERSAQQQLDSWLAWSGDGSVRAAVEADQTLGGACSTLVVSDAVAVKPLTIGDASYLTCEFVVSVHA